MRIKNEIFINGIKFVRADERSNIKTKNTEKKIGDVIKFSNLDWFIIDQDEDSYTLFMKECMSPELVKKHFTQKGMVDEDYDIRYSFTKNNDWKESYIRLVLNTSFVYDLDQDNLIEMDGDYVRLITKDEIEKLPLKIRKVNHKYGYWTMTPYSASTNNAFYDYTYGNINGNYTVLNTSAARPVVKIKRSVIDE